MPTPTPYCYTIPEIAGITRVSAAFLYRLAADGDLPCVRIGRTVRVRPADFEAWLADRQKNPPKAGRPRKAAAAGGAR